jgi:hypothetical protein
VAEVDRIERRSLMSSTYSFGKMVEWNTGTLYPEKINGRYRPI